MTWLRAKAIDLVWSGPRMPTWLAAWIFGFGVGSRPRRVK